MKLRRIISFFLILHFIITFLIFMSLIMVNIVTLRDSMLSKYEQETAELLSESQYAISEIFYSYIEHISENADLQTDKIISQIKNEILLDNLFVFDGNTFLVINERFRRISAEIDFNESYNEFLQKGQTEFSSIRKPMLENNQIPFIIFYKYIPDKNLYIGYVNNYEHITEHLVSADKNIIRTINKIGWISVIIQISGIGIVITFTLFFLSRLVLKPMKSLNEALAKIGRKDFNLSFPVFHSDEMKNMKNMIIEMSVQVQHAFHSMENQLKNIEEHELRYKTLIENLPQKIFLKDSNSVYVSCNSAFASDLKMILDEVIGKNDYDLYNKKHADQYQKEDQEILKTRTAMDKEIQREIEGRKRWVHIVKVPIKTPGKHLDYIIGIFWDITDRKNNEKEIKELNIYLEKRVIERTEELQKVNLELSEANRKLEEMTLIDPLTELPNRRAMEKALEQEWKISLRDKTELSVLILDVDHFKLYNDNYGHQSGDECLKKVALCIKKAITRPRDFCARYGGEEFIIILGQTPEAGALRVAEAIMQNLKEKDIPHDYSPVKKILTISIGIAVVNPVEELSWEKLVNWADKALYLAKKNGRNRIEIYEK